MALVRRVIPQLDLFGFLLFIPAAIMILLALQFGSGNTFAWNSATMIGLLVGGVVMAIIFIVWEWRMGELAMLPGNLIKQRVVWTSAGFGMGNMVCVIAASNFLPTYFQAVRGDSPTMSGVHVLPSILSQLLCVVTSGALSMLKKLESGQQLMHSVTRWGYYLPWALASGAVMTVGNGLISTFTRNTAAATWIGYQILLGAGRGLGMQTVSTPLIIPIPALTSHSL